MKGTTHTLKYYIESQFITCCGENESAAEALCITGVNIRLFGKSLVFYSSSDYAERLENGVIESLIAGDSQASLMVIERRCVNAGTDGLYSSITESLRGRNINICMYLVQKFWRGKLFTYSRHSLLTDQPSSNPALPALVTRFMKCNCVCAKCVAYGDLSKVWGLHSLEVGCFSRGC